MVLIDKKQHDYKLPLGTELPAFELPATDGERYSQDDFRKDVLIVAFWCNHCPYVKAAEPQFQELVDEYDNADFVCVNSNDATNYPEDNFEAMQRKVHNYIYLRDATQDVARAFGAECTPHVFVFDSERKLVYQGRIDDAGTGRPSTHELQDALDDLREGKPVRNALTAAMGCSIKWK